MKTETQVDIEDCLKMMDREMLSGSEPPAITKEFVGAQDLNIHISRRKHSSPSEVDSPIIVDADKSWFKEMIYRLARLIG